MKKLLVLVLVLAVASLASADPIWDLAKSGVGTSGGITVSVTSNPQSYVYLALGIVGDEGVLSNFAMGANAPASTAYFADLGSNFPEAGQGEIWIMIHVTTATPVFPDGVWLTADWAASSQATVSLYQFDDNSGALNFISSVLVPEPATIALLCLG